MRLMRETTVASVTEQTIFFLKKLTKTAATNPIRATTSFTPPYAITIPLLHYRSTTTYKTQQPTGTDHLLKRRLHRRKQILRILSIATSSFAPRYALAIPPSHFISTTSNKTQQLTRTELLPNAEFDSATKRSADLDCAIS